MSSLAVCLRLLFITAIIARLSAAEEPTKPEKVVVRVNGETVFAGEVDRETARAIGRRKVEDQTKAKVVAATLEAVIDRRLVHQWLDRTGRGATAAEVAQQLDRTKKDLVERKREWPAYLRQEGLTEDEWRRDMAWHIAWSRFVSEQFGETGLKAYFERRRRDFDGTRLHLRHLLLRLEKNNSAEATKALVGKATAIRDQLVGGKLSFEEAVRQHSQAPSKENGGDLGFVTRHGEHVETFSKAAFALSPGEISPPVVTPFGVHLIQCVEVKPGSKTLDDVREDVLSAATAELFRERAASERKNARIEYVR